MQALQLCGDFYVWVMNFSEYSGVASKPPLNVNWTKKAHPNLPFPYLTVGISFDIQIPKTLAEIDSFKKNA